MARRPSSAVVSEGLRLVNQGAPLGPWARTALVEEVRELATLVGAAGGSTKASMVTAIELAPRPVVVAEGVERVMTRRGVKRWGKAARRVEVDEVAARLGIDTASSKTGTIANIEAGAARARLVQRQISRFEVQRARSAVSLVDAFDLERLRLAERLAEVQNATPYLRLRGRMQRIDVFTRRLRKSLMRRFESAERDIHRQAVTDLETRAPIRKKAATRALEQRRKLKLHAAAIDGFVAQVRQSLVRSAVTRRSAEQIAGARSALRNWADRLALLARAETSRVYNDAQVAAGAHVAAKPDERVQMRIVEAVDSRNHPFSRAAMNRVALVGNEFSVPASEVALWGRMLRKSTGGIFWRLHRGRYVGRTLPAHYGDRGHIVVEIRS